MMTTCSTSAMVPVREFAGIDSARLMLAGKAAETAPLMSSWRNVRRSVVMTKHVLMICSASATKALRFPEFFGKLEPACGIHQRRETALDLFEGERALTCCRSLVWAALAMTS